MDNIDKFLSSLDYGVLAFCLGLLFVIAYIKGRKEADTGDFFLGSRKVPQIVACLSFVATEVSAITITSVPAASFSENWNYLQFFFGSAMARVFVAFLFIPVFYKYNCTSIYEFLRHRFGAQSQYAGSIFFFITRLLASGVRLYAASAAIALIMGFNLEITVLIFTVISILFIAYGGIKAVVWTGAYQALVFYITGIAVLFYLFFSIDIPLADGLNAAMQAGRLNVFNFSFHINDPTSFWAGTANAFFIGLAVFGTDQELVQRLLTVDTRKTSQKAIIGTILASLPILLIYLALGTGFYIFFQSKGNLTFESKDVLGVFTANFLPNGLKGLVLAAVILASIDSPLASLSSSFVMDIYKPLIKKDGSQRHYLLISRLGVIVFGIILMLIAIACKPVKSVLWFAFQIVSVSGGAALGVFLLGVLTKRKSNIANVYGMCISSLLLSVMLICSKMSSAGYENFLIRFLTKIGLLEIGWSWYIVIGTILTFLVGYIFGSKGKSTC